MAQFSQGVILVLGFADAEAQAAGYGVIEPAHLLLGLCKMCDLPLQEMLQAAPVEARLVLPAIEAEVAELREAFSASGLDSTRFRRRLRSVLPPGKAAPTGEPLHRSPPARKVFSRAEKLSAETASSLRPIHLLAAVLEINDPPWAGVLAEMDVRGDDLAQAARKGALPADDAGQRRVPSVVEQADRAEPKPKPAGPAAKASVLQKYGRDLTSLAAEGKLAPVIGRREEMRSLAQVLLQQRKSNAILVGEAGVGKTGVVEGLAQRLVGPKPPPGLHGKRLVEVTMAALIAGTKYRGEFEERMQSLVQEATADSNLILFIDEIHTLMGAGGEGSSDAANILKPALARGNIRCIGATTIAEYRKYIEKDPALERRFQVIWIDEPTRDEAVEILRGLKARLEEHHGLEISEEAIQAAVELSMRYLTDFRLPDKAIDLIDQACAGARMVSLSMRADQPAQLTTTRIGREDIARVIAQRCRIPVDRLTSDEAARLLRMEEFLGRRVIGQDAAVRAVCETIRTARVGLKNPQRPAGVFLFAGSTGTGKTELAKALAEFLFGDKRRLIRFDMSEYMEEHTVAKLIGAPPGYVGHDEEGQLTGPVHTNPYSVVLFDEIEKAHPRVLDIFLQIFDEGRLTDSRGRRASFTESVIILTSNLGCGVEPEPSHRGPLGFAPPVASHQPPGLRASQRRVLPRVHPGGDPTGPAAGVAQPH